MCDVIDIFTSSTPPPSDDDVVASNSQRERLAVRPPTAAKLQILLLVKGHMIALGGIRFCVSLLCSILFNVLAARAFSVTGGKGLTTRHTHAMTTTTADSMVFVDSISDLAVDYDLFLLDMYVRETLVWI